MRKTDLTSSILSLAIFLNLAIPSFATDVNVGGSVDYEDPVVSITAPPNGSTVSGITIISATASDDSGITKVEFYLDSILLATDNTSPYSFSWDTTTVSNGQHKILAKAYDTSGKTASEEFVVIINNLVLKGPTKTITNPTIEPLDDSSSTGSSSTVSLLQEKGPGINIPAFLSDQKDFVLGVVVGLEIFLIFLLIYLLRQRKRFRKD